MTVRDITTAIGREKVATALGVTKSSIKEAERVGTMPAAWFPVVRDIGRELGVDVPENLFRWRSASPPIHATDYS